jgi:hypothetical protein
MMCRKLHFGLKAIGFILLLVLLCSAPLYSEASGSSLPSQSGLESVPTEELWGMLFQELMQQREQYPTLSSQLETSLMPLTLGQQELKTQLVQLQASQMGITELRTSLGSLPEDMAWMRQRISDQDKTIEIQSYMLYSLVGAVAGGVTGYLIAGPKGAAYGVLIGAGGGIVVKVSL